MGAEFKRIWAADPLSKAVATAPVAFLLGVAIPSGGIGLWLFHYQNGFRPDPVPTWHVEGPNATTMPFEERLNKEANDHFHGGGLDVSEPRDWLLLVGSVFFDTALGKERHATVGGSLQICCIDHRGFYTQPMSHMDIGEVDGCPEIGAVRNTTPEPGELKPPRETGSEGTAP